MGFRKSHKCGSCGLRGIVRGGRDFGDIVETETRYCPHCQTLADVCLRLWCKDLLPGILSPSRVEELLAAEAELGSCPSCKRPGGQPWVTGNPCPRCGGVLQPTGEILIHWT
jgi:hypothetical protein